MKPLQRWFDPKRDNSIGNRMRRRRFELFRGLLETVPRPIRILDVGGRESFWEQMGFADEPAVEIVLINQERESSTRPNFECGIGDARAMPQFGDREFDIAFSNSVIEHVGGWREQEAMADEVRRIGRRFFVQTPNRSFPIEPHFLMPGFQFLPVDARVGLVRRLPLGYMGRIPDPVAAREHVESIRLLSGEEVRRLFPRATIYQERFAGLTKSYVAYGGWGA